MTDSLPPFSDLGLPPAILRAIEELGYERPSPIQANSVPPLLEGSDLLGQAQTGTGKTAAFAMPLLSQIDAKSKHTQLLILAPTRELAIQVAEACQQYGKYIAGLNVMPIYGGQSYSIQLKQLKRGAQVVVGTPGRVMDHMRRGTLSLKNLQALVLDEADEMLRMGFIDDVKWVLEQSPPDKQIALFSATMPKEIKQVADQHLTDPVHIKIATKTVTASNIKQRYWIVRGTHKLDAITRILENEDTDGVIVFVRTKNSTVELADKLSARGFRSEPLNGDIPQANREKVIDRLRKSKLDILVATDVVARGLDVERISHVINYDTPHDTESYIHRIGRTGRAGRDGIAILFAAPREKRLLRMIERATKQPLEPMALPSVADINQNRIERFKKRILTTISEQNLDFFSQLIAEIQHDSETSSEQIAAALAYLAQGDTPLQMDEKSIDPAETLAADEAQRRGKPAPDQQAAPLEDHPDVEMRRYRVAVGKRNGIKPGNIVGAIANEADLDSQYIGEIHIMEDYTTVDLPGDMPPEILKILQKARVAGRALAMRVYNGEEDDRPAPARRGKKPKKDKRRNSGKPKNKAGKRNPKRNKPR